MLRRLLPKLALASVLAFVVEMTGDAYAQGKAVILEANQKQLVLLYHPAPHALKTEELNGRRFDRFPDAQAFSGSTGSSSGLPVETFFIALPPEGAPSIEVESYKSITKPQIALCRLSGTSVEEGKVPIIRETYVPVVASASPAGLSPEKPHVRIARIFNLRYQRVAVVEVHPFGYSAAGQTLVNFSDLQLKILFPKTSSGNRVPDPQFESIYRSLLVNYEQAKQWRMPPSGFSAITAKSRVLSGSYDWFNPSQQYFRGTLTANGIVRITYSDLQALGLVPGTVDPRKIEIYYKGISLPLRLVGDADGQFNQNDFFEFYGSRLYDAPGIPNMYSDTSVYWLTFQGNNGPRVEIDSTVAGSPAVIADYFNATHHFERDTIYYYGDQGLPNNNQTRQVAGEGWYWNAIYGGQSLNFPVSLDNLNTTGNPIFQISFKVHSAVYTQATPNHSLQALVNGTTVGTATLAGYQDATIRFSGPVSLLTNGMNTVTLTSQITAASLNEVLVDWFDLVVPQSFQATADSIEFSSDRITPGLVAEFKVGGFTNPGITAYRLDSLGTMEKVFTGSVASGSGAYTFTFTDTIAAGRKYLVLTDSRNLPSPRFAPHTFVNLRSSSLGVDYLVITAPDFRSEADRLAAYRSQKGIGRTQVVSVDDIYDEFGYGIFDPTAIRRFLQSADSLWVPPKPSYVVLFGGANWDYKNVLRADRVNYVPSLGNPVSDELFVSSPDDPFLPAKFVGRIPCASQSEASFAVDQIINYESMAPDLWNKRYMFMVGGFDSLETLQFGRFSDNLISQYVAPAPLAGLASRIYRTSSQVVQFDPSQEVKKIIDDGAIWINYYGHGGTELWGNGITSADQLENKEGRRHVISDISCSTARFAEPTIDSFGGRLFFANQGGAIAFLGSSGFGFASTLEVIAQGLYRGVAVDSLRQLGKILLNAKVSLWSLGTGSVISQEALQQYTLIGDPALTIAVPTLPDYAVSQNQISSNPAIPTEMDTAITISAVISNFGVQGRDSVEVKVNHQFQNSSSTIYDRTLSSIGSLDTVTFTSAALSRAGLHEITITVDPGNRIAEVTKGNNSAQFALYVNSASILPVAPLPSSTVDADSVTIVVQNPGKPQMQSWSMSVELDTSSNFQSLHRILFSNVPQGIVATSVRIPPGSLQDATLYHWRARFTDAGDSTNWVGGFFLTNRILRYQWFQDRRGLFSQNSFQELSVGDTVTLDSHQTSVEAYSAGFSDGNNAAIFIDGTNIAQGFANRGYNVAVLNQYSGKLESFGAFSLYSDTPDTALARPLITYLNSIPAGRKVVLAIMDEGAVNKTEALNEAIEACGSGLIRSLGFRASWAMIGWKGAPIGSVPEALNPSGAGAVTLNDTLTFRAVAGVMSSAAIGPAKRWKGFGAVIDTSQPGTHVSFDVLRLRIDGSTDTLRKVAPGSSALSGMDARTTSSLKLRANLSSDSLGFTPVLSKWWVNYDEAPQLAVNHRTVSVSSDSLFEGVPLNVQTTIYNIGPASADDVLVRTSLTNSATGRSGIDSLMVRTVGPNSLATISQDFQTAGYVGTNTLLVQLDPGFQIPQLYRSGNALSLSITVRSDTAHPTFTISVDGSPVYDGDYVSPNPTILIDVFDSSPLPITDPTSVNVIVDNQPVTLGTSPDSLFEPRNAPDKALVTYRPKLAKGEHTLSVQVKDASGNLADTAARQVTFKVETEPGLLNVFNYPNPFAHQTQFTFNLVGTQIPDDLKIKIYTITGRLIQVLDVFPAALRIGFNRVPWDGRDRDGDELANGVYFYKVMMTVDGKSQEVIQKLAIVK